MPSCEHINQHSCSFRGSAQCPECAFVFLKGIVAKRFCCFPRQKTFVISFSGGKLSTLLLKIIYNSFVQQRVSSPVRVVHVDLSSFLPPSNLLAYKDWLSSTLELFSTSPLDFQIITPNNTAEYRLSDLITSSFSTCKDHEIFCLGFTPLTSSVFATSCFAGNDVSSAVNYAVDQKQVFIGQQVINIINPFATLEEHEIQFMLDNQNFLNFPLNFEPFETNLNPLIFEKLTPIFEEIKQRGSHYVRNTTKILSKVMVKNTSS
ncbi:hypothetical protein RCL1_001210 [Eukaryota sp. TZLM3-RCL]